MSDSKTEWHEGFTDGFLAGKTGMPDDVAIDASINVAVAEVKIAEEIKAKSVTPRQYREIENIIAHVRDLRAEQDALFTSLVSALRHGLITERGTCKQQQHFTHGVRRWDERCVLWLGHEGEHEYGS